VSGGTRIVLALLGVHLRRLRHDRGALLWLLLMPLVFSLLMGSMLGSFSSDTVPAVPILSGGDAAAARDVLALLPANARYRPVAVDTVAGRAAARAAVFSGRAPAALFLPGDLRTARGDTAILYYDSDLLSAQAARTDIERVLQGWSARRLAVALAADSPDGRFHPALFDSLWERPRVRLVARPLGRTASLPLSIRNGRQHVGPAYTLMFVLMMALMGVPDLVTARRQGTLRRLRLSAAPAWSLATGLFAGPFAVGLAQFAVLLLLNALLLGIDYGESPGLLVLVAVLFTAVASSLALWLATLCRTAEQASGIGLTVSLLAAALGGLWWPLEITPVFMQRVGLLLPTGQAITIFHDMIGRGYGVSQDAGHLLVLAATALVLLLLAARRFRRLLA